MLDPKKLRDDFPILKRRIHGKPLAYLDNAATSQKPQMVLDAMDGFYRERNANIHRGLHTLAEEATADYDDARKAVAKFINAVSPNEVVFTRGTTESINQLAISWTYSLLKEKDKVVLTEMEHHANLVPWYMVAEELNLKVEFVRLTKDGQLDLDDLGKKVKGAKVLSLTALSNVLGTINPITEISQIAHDADCFVFVDAAQAVAQMPTDVQALGCDALAFSSHKMLGPTGVGVLWARRQLLEQMPPVYGGGDMIKDVGLNDVTFADPPQRFEAGTMPLAETVGLQAAIDYLSKLGMKKVWEHEQALVGYATEKLRSVGGVTIYGPTDRGGLVSFNVDGIHSHDLATILDQEGLAIRSGRHCAYPLHKQLGVPGTARASFSVYNTTEEVDRLIDGIGKTKEIFQVK